MATDEGGRRRMILRTGSFKDNFPELIPTVQLFGSTDGILILMNPYFAMTIIRISR